MATITRLLEAFARISSLQLAAALAVAAYLTLAIAGRRVAVVLCAGQWLLLAMAIMPVLYRPVALVRLGVVVAIALMLFTSTGRRVRPSEAEGSSGDAPFLSRLAHLLGAAPSGDMGLAFRLVAGALGLLMSYGLWRAYPLTIVPQGYDLVLYEMLALALLLMLTSVDLLRRGLGLLTLIMGVQSLYLFVEQSLLVIAFWGLLSLSLALTIVYLDASVGQGRAPEAEGP